MIIQNISSFWRKKIRVPHRAVRLRLFEDPVRRTKAYPTVRWRTTVVIRLKGGCHVGQQISAQCAFNAVIIRGHVIAHDVLDMPRGPLTLQNGHVDPTAHMKRPDPAFRLQAISKASHSSPPKATSRAYRYISDASRVFWDCGFGSGGGTRGVTGFRTLFRKRIYNTVPKRTETPENRRYAVQRRITHYA
jgi:hypothetical protein